MSKPTHPRATLPDELYALRCPDRFDLFLAERDALAARRIVSRLTGRAIAPAELAIERIATRDTPRWTAAQTRRVCAVFAKAEAKRVREEPSPSPEAPRRYAPEAVMTGIDTDLEGLRRLVHDGPVPAGLRRREWRALAGSALAVEAERQRNAYLGSFWSLHGASFDRIGGHVVVFTVGAGAAAVMAIPLAASSPSFQVTLDDVVKVGAAAAIFVELGILIGKLLGVQTNAAKANEAIGKMLENSKVVAALLRFLDKVRKGAADAVDEIIHLIRLLYSEGLLANFVSAMVASALSFIGLAWLVATLLARFVPGLGWALTLAEIVAWIGGVAAKLKKLSE